MASKSCAAPLLSSTWMATVATGTGTASSTGAAGCGAAGSWSVFLTAFFLEEGYLWKPVLFLLSSSAAGAGDRETWM